MEVLTSASTAATGTNITIKATMRAVETTRKQRRNRSPLTGVPLRRGLFAYRLRICAASAAPVGPHAGRPLFCALAGISVPISPLTSRFRWTPGWCDGRHTGLDERFFRDSSRGGAARLVSQAVERCGYAPAAADETGPGPTAHGHHGRASEQTPEFDGVAHGLSRSGDEPRRRGLGVHDADRARISR